jgi:hypothetical protein
MRALTSFLNRHAWAKRAAYAGFDATVAGATRLGFDLRRRRAAFVGDSHRSIGDLLEWHAQDAGVTRRDGPLARATESIEIDPPHHIEVRPPAHFLDSECSGYSHLWRRVAEGYLLNSCEILELASARFHLPSGIVASHGRFPSETISLDGFPFRWQYFDCMRALWAPARHVPDGYLLSLQQSRNYYHWLCEVLPLAFALMRDEQWGRQPVYVGADLPPFVFEYLRLLGLDRSCQPLRRGVYTANRLRVASFPGGSEWPSPDHLRRVRDACLDAVGPAPTNRRRLYISRTDAVDRRVANEDDVLRAVGDLGFERVTLSGLGVLEQIRLFQTADIVLAPHGAGNANMLFAPADAMLLELMGPVLYSACFMVVTSSIGQLYGYVGCPQRGRDLVVDPSAVRTVLERLIRTREEARLAPHAYQAPERR